MAIFLIDVFPLPQEPYRAITRLSFPVHPLMATAIDLANPDLPKRSSEHEVIGLSAENGCLVFSINSETILD
jgi:hypothetical protein